MRIRDTEFADIPQITAIYADEVRLGTASFELEPPNAMEMERRWRDLNENRFPHLVAERERHVLGYAYAGPYRPRPAYGFTVENSVYVSPAARGNGIGKALLQELVGRCASAGFRQMVAVIGGGASHQASLGLHRSAGFRLVGVIEACGFKHGQWLDTVLMQRALGPGSSRTPPGSPGGG